MTHKRIEDETPILPFVIADSVTRELEKYLGRQLDSRESLIERIVAKGDGCYQHDECFRRMIRGTNGRDYMYMFMRHWLAAELYPNIKVPQSFANGQELEVEKP